MDRLWGPSGERPDPRRTARQCDDVLGLTETAASSARLLLGKFPLDSDDAVLILGMFYLPQEIFAGSRRWVEQRYTKLDLLQRAR